MSTRNKIMRTSPTIPIGTARGASAALSISVIVDFSDLSLSVSSNILKLLRVTKLELGGDFVDAST